MALDVSMVVNEINNRIQDLGFAPRDADGNDFERPDRKGLRFKTGTSYGEVAVQIWRDGKYDAMETIRILTIPQVDRALAEIGNIVDTHDFNAANGRL